MSEYWVISAPGDKTCQQTWDTLNNATKSGNLSANYKFPIPDLKVGTLDQLVGLSDDLGKLDTFVESVTRKVAQYLGEVLEDQRDKLHENLMANNKFVQSLGEFNLTVSKIKEASACYAAAAGVDSYGDPGVGEPPPTPTSPVCDSAFSDHHGCWPCEHREHSDCATHSQPSSGRSSPRWDDDEEDRHHILNQGLGARPDPDWHLRLRFDRTRIRAQRVLAEKRGSPVGAT